MTEARPGGLPVRKTFPVAPDPDARIEVHFEIPMPRSWSKKKRSEMRWRPHQQRPDVDNFLKALMECWGEDDSRYWDIRATKVWSEVGAVHVEEAP